MDFGFTITVSNYAALQCCERQSETFVLDNDIRNTEGGILRPQYTPRPLYCSGQGAYCALSTNSEVFLIFTTRLYQLFRAFFLVMRLSEGPEVFLPEYSQPAIVHAAHFR